jgi:DNA-binding transcriptional LysR family regulator
MPLNTRQLEVIRTVIRTGSVTDAANALEISQPAVSMVIKACEKSTGFPLFVRKQGRLQPTYEAKTLFPELERIFDGVERVHRLVEELKDSKVGLIRIAATPVLADNLLSIASRYFLNARPQVQISIHSLPNYDVADHVMTERVDLGFVLSPEKYLDTRVVDLYTSELVCVAPENHPLAKYDRVSPRELIKFPLISFSRSLPLGTLIDEIFRLEGFKRRIAVEITQSSTACAMVRAGVGLAILDPFALLGANGHGLVKIKLVPATSITAQLLMPANGRVSRPVRQFIDTVSETVSTFVKTGILQRGG